jgi:hypothetical protein
MNDTTTGRHMAAILGELGWPAGIPTERLAASVFDRAMRGGMFEAAVIMGFMFDRKECPAVVSRDDRLTVALHALCRFAAEKGRLEALRYDGVLASDEVLRSDGWTCASPRLPGMRGLYGAAGRERNGTKAGTRAEWKARNQFRAKRLSPPAGGSGT